METLDIERMYSTQEVAELLGCPDAKIRQLKSEHFDE
jgi:hypothetical protein